MTAVIGNKIVNNVGTLETIVLESNAFQRYTLLGLSVTNITNNIVYVDILLDGGHYLKDLVIPVGTSLRAVSTGEKLVLGYNSKITVKCSVDNAVDVISSYAAIANQALPDDLQLYEGYGISLTRDESQDILVGVDLRQLYVKIAADDSNIISVPLTDSIKISGQRNISTFSDADGNLTIEGPDLTSFLSTATELTITTEDSTSRQVAINGTLTFLGTGTVTTSFDQNGNIIINSPEVTDFDTAFGNKSTDDLTEGSTNLYYTDARARASVYQGTGVSYNTLTGEISIGQAVGTTDNVTFNNVTVSGNLKGPASFIIDPAAYGDATGTVYIAGNLEVQGVTTTVNSETVTIVDKNIVLASGSPSALSTDGAGITIDVANATFTYDATNDRWTANKNINANIIGTVSDISNHNLDALGNVSFAVAPTDGQSIIWDNANSQWIAGDSFNQADFDTAIAAVSIGDLSDVDITSVAPNVGQLLKWDGTKFAPADEQEDLTNNSIGDLGDVDITSTPPTNEQVLVWDAANSQFIPGDAAADFTDLTGSLALNQIPDGLITLAKLQTGVVFVDEFTADGSTASFTLSQDPGSKNALQIFVDGVPQRVSNYTVVGTTLTLGGTPTDGQIVEVRGYGVALPVGTVADNSITGAKIQDGTIDLNKIAPGDYYSADTFTGDGNTAVYTLSTDPGSPWAITVYVAGVWQKPIINYGVVGTTLTLSSNVPNGEEIYVRYYGVSLAVGTVADDSITGAKIQAGTITADKIAGSEYLTQSFTGDGSSTDFTLSSDPGAQQALLVLIDNVIQVPVTNYTVTGTTLAFTGAPDLNADIFVRYLGLPSPLVTVADNSISTAKLQDTSVSTAKLQDTSVTNEKLNLTYSSNQYTGDNATVDFTIESGHTIHDILVILDGYILPPVDYSIVNSTTLRFGVAPLQDQSIDIRYLPV